MGEEEACGLAAGRSMCVATSPSKSIGLRIVREAINGDVELEYGRHSQQASLDHLRRTAGIIRWLGYLVTAVRPVELHAGVQLWCRLFRGPTQPGWWTQATVRSLVDR